MDEEKMRRDEKRRGELQDGEYREHSPLQGYLKK